MTQFQILAIVCDAITPLMLLVVIVRIGFLFYKQHAEYAWAEAQRLMFGIALVYGWMGVDVALGLWPGVGLDYSTHTAAALALCLVPRKNRKITAVFVGLLVVYLVLMRLQNYHSWPDMLSTAFVISVSFLPFLVHKKKQLP